MAFTSQPKGRGFYKPLGNSGIIGHSLPNENLIYLIQLNLSLQVFNMGKLAAVQYYATTSAGFAFFFFSYFWTHRQLQ